MIRAVALAGLLVIGACNRSPEALTPDADAETRNTTAAKTLADIAAADEAARRPLPAVARPRATERTIDPEPAATDESDDSASTNEAAPAPQ